MKTRNLVLLALVLVAAVAGVTLALNWDQARQLRADQAVLLAQRLQQEQASERAAARLAKAERKTAQLPVPASVPAAEPAKPTPQQEQAKRDAEMVAMSRRFFERQKDPAWQLDQIAKSRARAKISYGPLLRRLGLTEEQSEKFYDVVGRRDEQIADLSAVTLAQNVSFDDPAIGKLRAKMDEDYEVAQRELLGDSDLAQLKDYERTKSLRQMVSAFVGVTTMAGQGLGADQAERLIQAMADADARYRQGREANALNIDWDAVDAQAASFLTPEQLTLFKTTEPPAGTGRFWEVLNRRMNDARTADKQAEAAVKR